MPILLAITSEIIKTAQSGEMSLTLAPLENMNIYSFFQWEISFNLLCFPVGAFILSNVFFPWELSFYLMCFSRWSFHSIYK